MSLSHRDYHYSVTVFTEDRAVLNCLRALSQISQLKGNVRIPWGGTKDADWMRDSNRVTFRFTSPEYRQGFVDVSGRILKPNQWREIRRSDSDPAMPQSD